MVEDHETAPAMQQNETVGQYCNRLTGLLPEDTTRKRIDSLLSLVNSTNVEDDIAEIDLRIEQLHWNIARLQTLRNVLQPRTNIAEVGELDITPRPKRRLNIRKPTHRRKLSGLALEAHNRRVTIARILARSHKGMTLTAIADATQIKFPGIMRTMICPYFAQLTHAGQASVYVITDKGRELAKE